MLKIKFAAIALAAAALVGCEPTPQDIQAAALQTKASISSPTVVGTLADGRPINRFTVVNAGQHNHVVYFIDRADVTLNRTITEGKTTRNVVQPALDASDDAILARAAAIQQERQQKERAEFERLKAIYGQ